MFAAIADLHARYLGSVPAGLTPLDRLLGLLSRGGSGPTRATPSSTTPCGDGSTGPRSRLVKWESGCSSWPKTPRLSWRPVCALPSTLAGRRSRDGEHGPRTACPASLTLIDWGLAADGPAELGHRASAGGAARSLFGPVGPDQSATIVERLDGLVALQREVAGASYDDDAMPAGSPDRARVAGVSKALDIVEHPDPAVRERERAALPWWLRQAELALEDSASCERNQMMDVNTLYHRARRSSSPTASTR